MYFSSSFNLFFVLFHYFETERELHVFFTYKKHAYKKDEAKIPKTFRKYFQAEIRNKGRNKNVTYSRTTFEEKNYIQT